VPQESQHPAAQLIEHVIGTLLHIWWRVARIGLIAGGSVALTTEIVGGIVARHFPGGLTHVTAIVLGVAAAYASAVTALITEILLGLLHTLRVLEGDAEAGALAAAAIARQEAHTLAHDLESLFGLHRQTDDQPSPAASAMPAPRTPVPARPLTAANANAPSDNLAATEAFAASLPPQLPPLPVRADRLPRIEWAEQGASPAPQTPVAEDVDTLPPTAGSGGSMPTSLRNPVGTTPSASSVAPVVRGNIFARLAPLAAPGAAVIATAVAERHPERSHEDTPARVWLVDELPVDLPPASTSPADTPLLPATPPTSEPNQPIAVALEPADPPLTSVVAATPEPPTRELSAVLPADSPEPPTALAVVPTFTTPDAPPESAVPAESDEDAPLVPPPAMPSQPLMDEEAIAAPDSESESGAAGVVPASAPTATPSLPLPIESDILEGPPTIPRPAGTRPTLPLARITSPLASPTSDPLTPPTGSGNLWDRLSKALMGIPPVQGEPDEPDTPTERDP
jgi:hypothetical protein